MRIGLSSMHWGSERLAAPRLDSWAQRNHTRGDIRHHSEQCRLDTPLGAAAAIAWWFGIVQKVASKKDIQGIVW